MNKITMMSRLAAIIGADVSHSKSPDMMNAAFAEARMDCYYFPFSVPEEDFDDVVEAIKSLPFMGLTITMPYKVKILRHLDEIDPLAKVIGAVNTVKLDRGRYIGCNTDGEGFVRGLEIDRGINVPDNIFFIVGAGGASKAITTILASRRPQKIYLFNRTFEKAEAICTVVNESVYDCCEPIRLDGNFKKYINKSTVLVNTTNVGTNELEGQSPLDTSFLHKEMLVADILYHPEKTKLLLDAEKLGCRIINGKSLLIHQGKIAFKFWTGIEAPADVMAQQLF